MFFNYLVLIHAYFLTVMKRLLLFAATCIFSINAFSQTFQHGLGICVFVDNLVPHRITTVGGLTYTPRLNFEETEKMSVSVGLPLSIAYTDNSTSYTDEYGDIVSSGNGDITNFTLDVPVIVNLSMWGGSSKLNTQKVGGFIGGGYAYHYTANRNYDYTDKNGDVITKRTGGRSYGPVANGGLRVLIEDTRYLELKFSYYRGMNRNKMNVFGFMLVYNF